MPCSSVICLRRDVVNRASIALAVWFAFTAAHGPCHPQVVGSTKGAVQMPTRNSSRHENVDDGTGVPNTGKKSDLRNERAQRDRLCAWQTEIQRRTRDFVAVYHSAMGDEEAEDSIEPFLESLLFGLANTERAAARLRELPGVSEEALNQAQSTEAALEVLNLGISLLIANGGLSEANAA
jgi:hypothetical protein